jgi:hypothetical protein
LCRCALITLCHIQFFHFLFPLYSIEKILPAQAVQSPFVVCSRSVHNTVRLPSFCWQKSLLTITSFLFLSFLLSYFSEVKLQFQALVVHFV